MKYAVNIGLLVTGIILSSVHCATSYTSIYSDRPIAPEVKAIRPLEIQFSRVPGEEEGSGEMAEANVNNSDYDKYMQANSEFRITDTADVKVVYATKTTHYQEEPGLKTCLAIATVFVFPVQTDSITEAEFRVFKAGVLVETYRYRVNQTSIWGWISIPLNTVVLPVANTVTEAATSESLELHKRLIDRFTRDFYHTSVLVNKGKVNRPGEKQTVFLVLEGQNTASRYKEQNTMASNLLGLALVNGGYTIRDNEDLKPVLEELSLSQSGLTRQNAVRIGEITGANKIITSNILYYNYSKSDDRYKITIVAHVTNINTGEVEWKNLYTLEGVDIESMLAEGSAKLLSDLRNAGYR